MKTNPVLAYNVTFMTEGKNSFNNLKITHNEQNLLHYDFH